VTVSAPDPVGPIKLMMFDLNWSVHDAPHPYTGPSAPHDWAGLDPRAYFDWQVEFGNNAIFLQAYTYGGYAFYPTRLGPTAPGAGRDLLPRLYDLTRKAGLPFWSYFCVGADVAMNNYRNDWVIPGSRQHWAHGFLGPESPWTDLLCARIEEFLSQLPVDWLLFDWFCYGNLTTDYPVQPAWFVERPFSEIIGRPMPERAEEITAAENLRYKREVLARQFYRLRETVRRVNPRTRIVFSPPYWSPADPLWVDHPMLNESDALLAEYSMPETMDWLMAIRRPGQRLVGTPMGCGGTMSVATIRFWVERGCDLSGYVWGTPPVLAPHHAAREQLEIVRQAFREIS
jgi:hypothetical protein